MDSSDHLGRIHPVLLSGGAGSRLWPLSRECFPKQLLPLIGEGTLLQQAARRADDPAVFAPLTVIANTAHRFIIAEQLRALDAPSPTIVLEPAGRNTGPAVAVAALLAIAKDPQAVLLVAPADHRIDDPQAFATAVRTGLPAAQGGRLVLFGVKPTHPATAYGYVRHAPDPALGPDVRQVAQFVEKPDRETASAYLATGDHLWNSGVFLLPARALLDEFERHAPQVLAAARRAVDGAARDLDFLRLDEAGFLASPSISIDHAVMEKTDRAAIVPMDCGWTDVGSWSALWGLGAEQASDNVTVGDVAVHASSGSYLRSEGPLVAAVGIKDMVVVATPDAVLVAPRSADQDVKAMVEQLRRRGHPAADQTARTYRPWGWSERVLGGANFEVRRLRVDPGRSLSLQLHRRRSEHWVVVSGRAAVLLDGEAREVAEGESIFIPANAPHRLSNPETFPLELIEVLSGEMLDEADVIRLEAAQARPPRCPTPRPRVTAKTARASPRSPRQHGRARQTRHSDRRHAP